MLDLKDKNILIIMPKFYAYQSKMAEDLKARGAKAAFYDEEPEKTRFLLLKNIESLLHIKNIFKGFNKKLLSQIKSEAPTEGYDYFLMIRGNVISPETVEAIKAQVCKRDAKTVYYSWDSFANLRHKGAIGDYFDDRATFDSVDAAEHTNYRLLPLFYSDEFDGARLPEVTDYKYDYVSVSAFFPFRYRYFKAFKEANPDLKLNLKIYLDPKVYKAKKVKNPAEVANLDMDIISFEPFAPETIRDMVADSRAVLDLAHEAQTGLTMRTMETLGIRRKLVTNNTHLRDYPFYNPDNQLILEDLPAKVDAAEASGDYSAFKLPGQEWLEAPYAMDEDQRICYSIHAWIENLLK